MNPIPANPDRSFVPQRPASQGSGLPLPRMRRAFLSLAALLALTVPMPMRAVTEDAPAPAPLSLAAALALAERHHPGLEEAAALVRAAEGRVHQAGTRPAPELLAGVEAAPLGDRFARQADYLAGLAFTLPLGNRMAGAVRVESADRDRTVLGATLRRLEVRRQVQGAFATALFQQEAARLRHELAEVAREAVELATRLVEAGEIPPAEIGALRIEDAEAAAEQQRCALLQTQALATLAAAVGLPMSSPPVAVEGQVEASLELPALEELGAALSLHPALGAAEASVAASSAGIALTRALRVPDLRAEILYRRSGSTGADGVDFGLSVPLPWPNRSAGRLEEATALREAAEARRRATRTQLDTTLRTAHARLASALADIRRLDAVVLPATTLRRSTAESRLAQGDIPLPEVLPLRRDSLVAGLRRLEALREAMLAWADLRPFLHLNP